MNFKKLIEVVAYFYNIKPADICGNRRKKNLVKARQVVCYFARKGLKQSYPSIGRELGNRDHTTIIHASRKINSDLEKDEDLKLEIETISKLLGEKKQYLKEYFLERQAKQDKPKKDLLYEIKQLSKINLSPEQIRRQKDALKKYEAGWTLADIARKHGLTRERIRQITKRALLYEAKKIADGGTELDLKEFLKDNKEEHLGKMRERYGFTQKKDLIKKEKKWSRGYDYCRKCATRTIKHHSYGYCRRCYPKTELFKSIQKASRMRNVRKRKERERKYLKEYLKRPEIIERMKIRSDQKFFGGNREKAILRDNERCRDCRLSRQESYKKYGRDLCVLHIISKRDNRLESLKTLCPGCFSSTVIKRASKNRWKV